VPLESFVPTDIPADQLQGLFDDVPDIVFFVKDVDGRYSHANHTLVRRLRLKKRSDVIGKRVTELFPLGMADSYAAQDQRVLGGDRIDRYLEVHVVDNLTAGWCLTSKRPLIVGGRICGLIGISRDLRSPDGMDQAYGKLQRVMAHMHEHFAEDIRVGELAKLAGFSVAQLERHFRRVFQITPHQALTKIRIEAVMRQLRGTMPIGMIGLASGFPDQSSFARRFKAVVGVSPGTYRALCAKGESPSDCLLDGPRY